MPSLYHLSAPAKLNLFLHVTGRRADGYHLLQSVFVIIDWADTLHIDTRSDGQIHRHDLGLALPANDLCLRAARLLQQESGCPQGADIHIDKQVPWGAGMGGGSSDAATVLKALNGLWQLHWPTERLEALALQLGADVPFFVRGQHAWVEGVGERITPIVLPAQVLDTPLAVLKPPVAVPTAAIFGSPLLPRDTPPTTQQAFLADPLHFGHNDLQAPAMAHTDQIGQALGVLHRHFGHSRMTGSGSAVFAWAPEAPHLAVHQRLAKALADLPAAANQTGWAARLCRVLPLPG